VDSLKPRSSSTLLIYRTTSIKFTNVGVFLGRTPKSKRDMQDLRVLSIGAQTVGNRDRRVRDYAERCTPLLQVRRLSTCRWWTGCNGKESSDKAKISPSARDPVREKRSWGCFVISRPSKAHLDNVELKRRKNWRLGNYS
jgi:hypothetical protein